MDHSPRFLALVDAVRASVREIDPTDLDAWRATWPRGLVLDVREDREWAAGHIPDAVHLARGVLERDIEGVAPDPATPIVLYCGGGYRSALAARSLADMGYTAVWSLAGGVRTWKAQDRPWQASG